MFSPILFLQNLIEIDIGQIKFPLNLIQMVTGLIKSLPKFLCLICHIFSAGVQDPLP